MKNDVYIKNKKAWHEYEILDKYVAGIQLKGTEIKSIRQGKVSMNDSFCHFDNGELWVHHLHISAYDKASHQNHEPKRTRKLLLRKQQLKRLAKKVREKRYTIVPLSLFIAESGYAKLEIALAKGKKKYDKREAKKKKDMERQMERELKRWQ